MIEEKEQLRRLVNSFQDTPRASPAVESAGAKSVSPTRLQGAPQQAPEPQPFDPTYTPSTEQCGPNEAIYELGGTPVENSIISKLFEEYVVS